MGTRIQLVGPIAVLGDAGVVTGAPLAGRRVRLVLVALATTPAGLSSTSLADRVWTEPPSTWPAALRGTILALRAALEPIGLGGQTLVRTIPGGWALAPDTTVDLFEAAAVVSAAERLLADGAAESAIEALEGIAEVMGGELLGGELLGGEDAGWVTEWRDQLASLTDRALAVEGEASLILARYAGAANAARRLLDRNALDERAHRVLIRALAASGDRAGAIRAYEQCRSELAEQLGTDPGPETAALYLQVLRSGSAAAGTLPSIPRNGFFGRRAESTAAQAALAEAGLLTIVGRGGVGKTRFALHAATDAASQLSGGRFWVSLGDVSDALVVVTVARAIGADEGADPLAATIARLAPLGPSLLVLDGCENAVDGVAELLAILLAAAPELRVLATSRRALDVAGERKIELASLSVPSAGASIASSAAVRLLVDRLALTGHALPMEGSNSEAIRQLCSRCGGLPLALELAAAQLGLMAVTDLLDLLPAAARAEEVVQSLLMQSVEALSDDAAALFRAWGVVEGALPLSLATRLSPGAAPGRVARLLGELVDGGLLLIDRSGARWQYQQDDQVRAFARAALTPPAADAALSGLVDGLRALLPDDPRTPPSSFRDAATEASDGFRTVFGAALNGSVPRETGLELAFRLHRFWTVTSMAEGRYWLTLLLEAPEPSPSLPFASFAAGYLSYWAGDSDRAQTQLEDAATRLRDVDNGYAARSLMFAAGIADDHDRPQEALQDVRTAILLAETTDDVNLQMSTSISIASILAERGDPAAADYAAQAVERSRARASNDQLLATLATAALVCWQVGVIDQARAAILEADALLDGGPRIARATWAVSAAGVALFDGRLEQAARLVELAVRDGEELGIDRELPLSYALTARIAAARGRMLEAAQAALEAVDRAERLDFAYPMAICLETAAEMAALDEDATALRAVASRIRDVGDRPAPACLAPSLPVASSASSESIPDAIQRARRVLTTLTT